MTTISLGLPITVLITGSRDWPYRLIVEHALDVVRFKHSKNPITVMHGACETGADAMADSYAMRLGLDVMTIPAQWSTYGRAAGPLRNKELVRRLGESAQPVCLAFNLDNSRGTTGTLRMVQDEHLPWRLYSAHARMPGKVNYVDWKGRVSTYSTAFVPAYRAETSE